MGTGGEGPEKSKKQLESEIASDKHGLLAMSAFFGVASFATGLEWILSHVSKRESIRDAVYAHAVHAGEKITPELIEQANKMAEQVSYNVPMYASIGMGLGATGAIALYYMADLGRKSS